MGEEYSEIHSNCPLILMQCSIFVMSRENDYDVDDDDGDDDDHITSHVYWVHYFSRITSPRCIRCVYTYEKIYMHCVAICIQTFSYKLFCTKVNTYHGYGAVRCGVVDVCKKNKH